MLPDVIKGAAADPTKSEFTSLPDNWPIRWKRFTDGDQPDRFARRIATHLAPPLKDLTNGGEDRTDESEKRILKRLAPQPGPRLPAGHPYRSSRGRRSRRGPLTKEQLLQGDQGVADALLNGDLLDAIPLWFYVLKEAEVTQCRRRAETDPLATGWD